MGFDLNWYLTRGENISNFYRSPDGLGREPDPVGLYNWIFHAREEGWTDDRIRQTIWNSEEWHAIHDPKPRPTAVRHPMLPSWDASDAFGDVHTVPPPELVIPPNPDPLFMRADFNGVVLNVDRWGMPPFLLGANSTPRNMLMTPMAPMYPTKFQDAILTEHAERAYSHFIVASSGWNMNANGFNWTPTQFADWCKYVQSWGFKVVYWGDTTFPDPYLDAIVKSGVIDFHIVGEEVDSKMTSEQYDAALRMALVQNGGVPTGAHFTANYPEGFPRDTFLTNWNEFDGRVHLMWQANQFDSAGKQAAMLYYARQRVNLGLVGGNSQLAPNSRVYAYEVMASAQLYGKSTEEYGNLRSLELLYATRRDGRILPVSGFGNGARLPDGSPV